MLLDNQELDHRMFFMLALIASVCLSQSDGLMTSEEYSKVKHSRPYVLQIQTESTTILYFGIGHTRDPKDWQLKIADDLWSNLKPQVAIHESSTPRLESTLEDSVLMNGEPGWVGFKAKSEELPLESLDPSKAQQVESLAKQFDPEILKSFYVLQNIYEYKRRPTDRQRNSIDAVATANLLRLSAIPALKGKPTNATELRAILQRVVGPDAKIESPPLSWFDPGLVEKRTTFNDIAKTSSLIRDRFMIDRIVQLAQSNRRAFIMMGASHVVMQEPALRKRLPKATFELLMGC